MNRRLHCVEWMKTKSVCDVRILFFLPLFPVAPYAVGFIDANVKRKTHFESHTAFRSLKFQ